MRIRAEEPRDRAAIFAVNEAAFGRPDEARLVDALREVARTWISLVADPVCARQRECTGLTLALEEDRLLVLDERDEARSLVLLRRPHRVHGEAEGDVGTAA